MNPVAFQPQSEGYLAGTAGRLLFRLEDAEVAGGAAFEFMFPASGVVQWVWLATRTGSLASVAKISLQIYRVWEGENLSINGPDELALSVQQCQGRGTANAPAYEPVEIMQHVGSGEIWKITVACDGADTPVLLMAFAPDKDSGP